MKENKSKYPADCLTCRSSNKCLVNISSSEEAAAFHNIRKVYEFERGDEVPFSFGKAPGFHIVSSGSIKVSFGEKQHAKTVKILGAGALFGYCCYGMPGHLAEATESTRTCFFDYQDFEALRAKAPDITKNLLNYLCQEGWKNSARLWGLANHSVKERVTFLLRDLAQDFGTPSEHGVKIDLKISRTVLGEMAGAVTETLARVLTELEREKLIVRDKWTLHWTGPLPRPATASTKA